VSALGTRIAHAPRDGRNVFVIWLVCTAVAVPLIVLVLGPHLPPGRMTNEASAQTDANVLMTALVTPIVLLIWIFCGYSLFVFRARGAAIEDGRPNFGNATAQVLWLAITTAIVLTLAVWGSYELIAGSDGAGGGQGPSPIALPAHHQDAYQVQVIGQQWQFTYRYPSLNGLESNQLVLPANRLIELHVTSLDVVHSFWAVELGLKADANPGVDNIVYVETKSPTVFHVRCAELCGLWHGYMYNNGRIVDSAQFDSWATQQQRLYAAIEPFMNKSPDDGGAPYAHTYLPAPERRAG
jgi:cytochrome c oxidase subunit 2